MKSLNYEQRLAQSVNFELQEVLPSYMPLTGLADDGSLQVMRYELGASRDTVTVEIDGVTVYATEFEMYTDGEHVKAVWVAGEDEDGKQYGQFFVEWLPVQLSQLAGWLFHKAKEQGQI